MQLCLTGCVLQYYSRASRLLAYGAIPTAKHPMICLLLSYLIFFCCFIWKCIYTKTKVTKWSEQSRNKHKYKQHRKKHTKENKTNTESKCTEELKLKNKNRHTNKKNEKKVEQKKLKHTQHGIGICRSFGCSQCACNTHRMNVTVL